MQDPYWGERLRKHDINSIWLRSENGFVLDFNLNMPSHQTIFLPQVMQFGFELVHFRDANFSKPISQLHELFVFGLQLFQPFYAWGTMSGEVNYSEEYRKRPSLRETDLPPVVEWFNYYDSSIVERLGGLEKLLSVPVFLAEPVEDLGGVILILQQEPFDYTNPDHLENRRRVEEYLELPRLHQQFQKS
ncbi:MAG: immunity 52 family protein [Ardenticatenaceae bacterium]|nr:immunity 52 family protein [Ardenticatenaceae bacterium]